MQLTQAGALPWQAAPAPLPAAARGTRRRFSVQRGPQQPVRAAADFASLRSSAADAVAQAQAKLPLLEAAQRTASQAREPAAEAERHWQELHGRLTALQGETVEATKQLRSAVTAAAGGEWEATHALLQVHVKERLEHFRINQGLALATEWKVRRRGECTGGAPAPPSATRPPTPRRRRPRARLPPTPALPASCPCCPQVFPVQDLPLHSIPGGRMLYQLAAAELEGQHYALVSLGISNPFLFENLRSLLMHWGVSESLHSQWAQPPRGWHTSPGVSTVRGWARRRGGAAAVLGRSCYCGRHPGRLTPPAPRRPRPLPPISCSLRATVPGTLCLARLRLWWAATWSPTPRSTAWCCRSRWRVRAGAAGAGCAPRRRAGAAAAGPAGPAVRGGQAPVVLALPTPHPPARPCAAGYLEVKGGIKCVLRRTDHGQPEWIKAG